MIDIEADVLPLNLRPEMKRDRVRVKISGAEGSGVEGRPYFVKGIYPYLADIQHSRYLLKCYVDMC